MDELVQFIKADIDLINKGIQKDNPLLLDNIEKNKHLLFIEKDFMIDLLNKYCFQSLPLNYNYYKGYVPKDRLELFESLFTSGIKKSEIYNVSYVNGGTFIYSMEQLYIRLFLTIYIESLITSLEIKVIIKKLLDNWKFFLEEQKLPVEILTFLPEVFIEKEAVKLPNNFEIKTISSFLHFEKTGSELSKGFEVFGPMGSFLIFKTEISCNHNFIKDHQKLSNIDQKILIEEWKKKMKSLKELTFSLLLGGINFTNESTVLSLPWWFGDQELKFKRKNISIGAITITDKYLKLVNEIYEMVLKLDIINDKELELALFKYGYLLKKKFLYDMILDEFIILESIFSKGGTSEVSYRLSSNLAFFLAEDIEYFKEIYNCIKDLYSIRNKIAHGEDWTKGLSKEKYRKHLGIDDPNAKAETIAKGIYSKLRYFIDEVLKKIIEMKYERIEASKDPNIMKDFKGTYFIENSNMYK